MTRFALLLLPLLLAGCATVGGGGFPAAMELLPVNQSLEPLRSSQLDGRVVVVTYFDPNCQLCQTWLRTVEEVVDYLIEERDGEGGERLMGMYVIGGATALAGGDPRPTARTYLLQHRLGHEAYWDRQMWLAERVPDTSNTTYVFDRQGRLVFRQAAGGQATAAAARRLEAAIVRAL